MKSSVVVIILWSMVLFSRPCGKQCHSVRLYFLFWWAATKTQLPPPLVPYYLSPTCSVSVSLLQQPWCRCVYSSVCECVCAHIRMPAAMCNTVRARVEKHTPRIPETAAHMAYLLVLLLVEPFGFLIFKFSYTLESSFILWKSWKIKRIRLLK